MNYIEYFMQRIPADNNPMITNIPLPNFIA